MGASNPTVDGFDARLIPICGTPFPRVPSTAIRRPDASEMDGISAPLLSSQTATRPFLISSGMTTGFFIDAT